MIVRPATLVLVATVLLVATAAAARSPEEAVDAYLGFWNGDGADPAALVSDDFRRHARPGESPRSAAELADLVARTRANFERVTIEVDELFCDGDRCALRGSFTGRIPHTDRGVRIPLSAVYRVEDGLVAEEWVVANQLPTMFGLGYTLAAPGFEVRPAASAPRPPETGGGS